MLKTILSIALFFFGAKTIEWQKDFASAKRISNSTGKPMVLVFCAGTKGGDCCGGAGGLAQRFTDVTDEVNSEDFVWVLVEDKAIAQLYNVAFPGMMVVCDPEGTEIKRGIVGRTSTMVNLLRDAMAEYQGPLSWQNTAQEAKDKAVQQNRLLLVFFEDAKGHSKKTLEALSSRQACLYRKKLVYLRLTLVKESKEAAEFKAFQAPQIVIYDPRIVKESERILGTAIGSRNESQIRAFLEDTFRKAQDAPKTPEAQRQETPRK